MSARHSTITDSLISNIIDTISMLGWPVNAAFFCSKFFFDHIRDKLLQGIHHDDDDICIALRGIDLCIDML